jgi:hypothetical protein
MNVVKAAASNHTQREQGLEPPIRNAAWELWWQRELPQAYATGLCSVGALRAAMTRKS